jgi:uncharacterized UBP type Zn finger protein
MQQKICSYPKDLKKEDLLEVLQKAETWKCANSKEYDQGRCGTKEDLWICLNTLKPLCGRNTEAKCMIKHYEESNHKYNICLSVSKNMIWSYECDDSVQNIIQTAKLFNENAHEDEEIIGLENFFATVTGAVVDYKMGRNDDDSDEDDGKIVEEEVIENAPKDITQQDDLSTYVSPSKKYVGKSVFGSSNLGNTCFFNSAMQCMNATRPLVEQYIENRHRFEENGDLLKSKNFQN